MRTGTRSGTTAAAAAEPVEGCQRHRPDQTDQERIRCQPTSLAEEAGDYRVRSIIRAHRSEVCRICGQRPSSGVGRLGRNTFPGFLQPVSVLDQLHESFHKARCRSTVDDIVVKGDR